MQFINNLKKYIYYIYNAKSSLRTDADIQDFKQRAWKSRKAASTYAQFVENTFFDAVTADLFVSNIPKNSNVLDVGAGTGRLSRILACSNHVTACDISKEMLAHVNRPDGLNLIKTVACNALEIPLDNAQFDSVVSMDLLVHFKNWEQMLKEQARLCKVGGTVMFNFISADNIHSLNGDGVPGTVKDFYYVTDYAPIATRDDILKAASRCNMEIEFIQPYNFFSGNAWFCRFIDKARSDRFVEFFNANIENPDVRNFVSEFERTIVRNLPLSSCSTIFVKLRKIK